MNDLLSALWLIIPESLRPFIWPAIGVSLVYYLFKDKRNKLEIEADAWDNNALATVRADNDRMSRRNRELEEGYPKLRTSYDLLIAQMRSEQALELGTLSDDRTRGWDLARAWCDYAHTLRHWINNKLMLIPEDRRPLDVPPIPAFERIRSKPSEAFPERYVVDPGSRPPQPS